MVIGLVLGVNENHRPITDIINLLIYTSFRVVYRLTVITIKNLITRIILLQ